MLCGSGLQKKLWNGKPEGIAAQGFLLGERIQNIPVIQPTVTK